MSQSMRNGRWFVWVHGCRVEQYMVEGLNGLLPILADLGRDGGHTLIVRFVRPKDSLRPDNLVTNPISVRRP